MTRTEYTQQLQMLRRAMLTPQSQDEEQLGLAVGACAPGLRGIVLPDSPGIPGGGIAWSMRTPKKEREN